MLKFRLTLLVAAAAVVALGAASPAMADGPSGSHEENQTLTCAPDSNVYAGDDGIEICNDDDATPVQGRIIVTSDQGGYIAVDGDSSSGQVLGGYVRIDGNGLHCSSGDQEDSTTEEQPGCEPSAP